jgi:hypothetical protein
VSREQRIAFLAIAAVIAIVAAVVIGASGGDDEETTTGATQTATATPAETVPEEASPVEEEPTATPTPEPKPPLLTAEQPRTLEFKEGDRIEFRVRHDAPEHVHVHGYDIVEDLEPGKTVTLSFKADITGIFEVELEDSATPIGELKVEP